MEINKMTDLLYGTSDNYPHVWCDYLETAYGDNGEILPSGWYSSQDDWDTNNGPFDTALEAVEYCMNKTAGWTHNEISKGISSALYSVRIKYGDDAIDQCFHTDINN